MGRQTETQAGVDIDTGRQTRRRKAGRRLDIQTGEQAGRDTDTDRQAHRHR